jgi:SSS family solute:Na+ symporter
MATKDARSASKAFATQLTVTVIVTLTLGLVGFALLGYSKAHPGYIPEGLKADDVFPHFIAFHLPPGISGLVISAMFAAAMSSIDSGVNSITAVVMTDGFDRFGRAPQTDRQHVLTARWLAFGIGAFVVLLSSTMGLISGNITEVTNKTSNLLTTPIFGLFFFALFVPFASPKGVWIGAICGTTTAVLIAFSGPIFGFLTDSNGNIIVDASGNKYDPISFQWIAPAAITVNIVTGCLGSLLFPRKDNAV